MAPGTLFLILTLVLPAIVAHAAFPSPEALQKARDIVANMTQEQKYEVLNGTLPLSLSSFACPPRCPSVRHHCLTTPLHPHLHPTPTPRHRVDHSLPEQPLLHRQHAGSGRISGD